MTAFADYPDARSRERLPGGLRFIRKPLRDLSIGRIIIGGRLNDAGRLGRYAVFALLGVGAIWGPITGYLMTAPLGYTTKLSLILPGSGAAASVNLHNIGQATSFANSAFASSSISPTETYKRLIGADRILAATAEKLGIARHDLNAPRIELVDQTSLIRLEMTGASPADAQARGSALLAVFFDELDILRADEQAARQTSGEGPMEDYRISVSRTRAAIAALQIESGLLSPDQYDQQLAANDVLTASTHDLAVTLAQETEAVARLEASLAVTAPMAAATLKLYADSDYAAIVAEMSDHAAELARARARFGVRHPLVEQARAAHAGSRRAALAQVQATTGLSPTAVAEQDLALSGVRASLLAELVAMDARRAGVAAQFAAMDARLMLETARLQSLAPAAARLEDMKRDFAIAEAVFASAIARTQSSKADVYASYPLVQVLEDPSLPDQPSSPKLKLAIAAGGAATFMLLVGLGLGRARRSMISRLLAGGPAAR
ncbi:MAG: hypothetical protein ACJAW4_002816 [Paracoccaceae bacterium]|jgi:uncharacterized protein involved in exopolysaccharide biosynthesis